MSCEKATYLLSKKGSSTLSVWERISMFSHLCICRFCRRFKRQTEFIEQNAPSAEINAVLPDEVKTRMKEVLLNG